MTYLFDDLARTLAGRKTPRRQSLKLLGALLANGILGAVGIGRAVAEDGAACGGKRCKAGQGCCNGHCVHLCSPRLPSCPAGSVCVACASGNGVFYCKAG
jgi:hypothetical protein